MEEVKRRHTGGRTKGDGKGKTGGRKKGSPNKVTRETRECVGDIVDGNLAKAQEMLDLIVDPDIWLRHFEKLLEYRVPKMAAISITETKPSSDLASELDTLENKEID